MMLSRSSSAGRKFTCSSRRRRRASSSSSSLRRASSSVSENKDEDRDKKKKMNEIKMNWFKKEAELPNGAKIKYVSRVDVKFLYDEIYVEDAYEIGKRRDGGNNARVVDGDDIVGENEEVYTIVDVGANIGLFALKVLNKHRKKRCALYAFEPSRAAFEALTYNLKEYDDSNSTNSNSNNTLKVKLINKAVGNPLNNNNNGEDSIEFTSYPNAAGWSTCLEDEEETYKNVMSYAETLIISIFTSKRYLRFAKQFVENVLFNDVLKARTVFLSSIVSIVLKWLTFAKTVSRVKVVSISKEIFQNMNVSKINLLKIDVERFELDVLQGINEEDWLKIESVCVEVHDGDDRLGVQKVRALLLEKGRFKDVTVEQPESLKHSYLFNVFAERV